MRIAVIATAMCFSMLGLATADDATAAMRKPTNIAAQPLGAALKELAAGHGLQVLYFSDTVRDLRTNGAAGDITIDQAFDQLLAGTGLTYRYLDEKTVTVIPIASGAASTSASASAADANASRADDAKSQARSTSDIANEQDQKAGRSFWDRFRLAQVDPGRDTSGGPVARESPQAAEGKPFQLEEVVVTGTHIRGESPVGSSVKVYTHEDLTRSGAATVDQFARQMVENFSGADTVSNPNTNIGYARFNGGGINNGFEGAALDLHGLGPAATLTLLNGHRLAAGGYDGSLADISQIPLSAIDHIEVLADGASAIYGADAVAGVVNIVARKDFSGAETSLRYGGATAGGVSEFTGSQLLGGSWGSGNAFINYEYDRQNGLDASDRDYIPDLGGPNLILPRNRRNSVFLSGSQDVGAQTTLSGDAIYTDRDFFGQSFLDSSIAQSNSVYSGSTKQFGATATLDHALFGDWHASLTGSYSKLEQGQDSTNDAVFGAFSQHARAVVDINTEVTGADLLATGSLFSLPGGPVKAAVGTSYRAEQFESTTVQTINAVNYSFAVPGLQRHVTSAFAELIVPVIGESNTRPGVRRLEFSAAGRYDHYSDFGSTTNPRLGLAWEPVRGLGIRGSYGKSFRAPLLNQIGALPNVNADPFPDPAAPAGYQDTLIINGGNPNLRPEHSTSYTAGFDVKPQALPSFRFAATYFHIDFRDRIATPPVVGANYFHDPAIASFLTLNPSLATVEDYFNSPAFAGDQVGLGPTGVTAIFDARQANIAASKISGVDLTAGYDRATAYGHFDVSAAITRLIDNDFQTLASVPTTVLLDTFGEPTRWKARSSVAWQRAGFGAMFSLSYVSSYQNSLLTPPQTIDSWTTGDLYLSYDTGAAQSADLLKSLRVALSVLNLTDKRPPYATLSPSALLPGQSALPYDSANASPIGRVISLQVSKRW